MISFCKIEFEIQVLPSIFYRLPKRGRYWIRLLYYYYGWIGLSWVGVYKNVLFSVGLYPSPAQTFVLNKKAYRVKRFFSHKECLVRELHDVLYQNAGILFLQKKKLKNLDFIMASCTNVVQPRDRNLTRRSRRISSGSTLVQGWI